MKFAIPEISWHNRDPVLSVDFQPRSDEKAPLRLATGGTDSHVLIWYLSTTESGGVNLEVAADLTRHQKAVNVVRWSPNSEMLASGDDESIIFVWKQKAEKEVQQTTLEGEEQYKESWVIYKTLRGHMEDVLDLSWSPDSLHLASGSVDNKLVLWDVARGRSSCILSDHKGFVQGVAWDPKGQYIATLSSDRTFRAFDVSSKKVVARSSKAVLPFPQGHPLHDAKLRLYHDDTLQTFYRRLQWSPDGQLLAAPAGRAEPDARAEHPSTPRLHAKPQDVVYIYTRYSLKTPMCVIPCGEPALCVRWARAALRPRARGAPPPPLARRVLAVGTRRCVLLYDTQQKPPLALISNIHYTRLTDLTWSCDGLKLVASSTDGFCSVITFTENELGERLPIEESTDIQTPEPVTQAKSTETIEKDKLEVNKLTPRSKNEKETPVNKLTPRSKADKEKPEVNKLTLQSKAEKEKSEVNKLTPRSKADKEKPEVNKLTPPSKAEKEKSEVNKLTPRSKADKAKSEVNKLTPRRKADKEKPEANKLTPRSSKLDSFIKFKTPPQKSEQKTPVKMDVLEEVAMPSWSDNSSNEIIRPKDTHMEVDIMVIEDSEDIKLVYEETRSTHSQEEPEKSPTKSQKSPMKSQKSPPVLRKSPRKRCESPKSPTTSSSASESTFLKQARVTDVVEAAPASSPGPKAPRRVNFVTLSSPKNKKKK